MAVLFNPHWNSVIPQPSRLLIIRETGLMCNLENVGSNYVTRARSC